MRTERITLELTHDLDARLSDWIVEVVDESLGMMESVRVVDEPKLAPDENADGQSTHAASGGEHSPDAGKMVEQEPVAWGVRNPKDLLKCGEGPVWSVRATKEIAERAFQASEGWIHFPLFDAPPPPRGWLTEEEREAIDMACQVFNGRHAGFDQRYAAKDVLSNLLDRSTPPEVVLPRSPYEGGDHPEDAGYVQDIGWGVCMDAVKEALAAAGVAVKEVNRE